MWTSKNSVDADFVTSVIGTDESASPPIYSPDSLSDSSTNVVNLDEDAEAYFGSSH